jgi:hypothetical protein
MILNHFNSVPIITAHPPRVYFNIILGFPNGYFPRGFSAKILYEFLLHNELYHLLNSEINMKNLFFLMHVGKKIKRHTQQNNEKVAF